MNKFQIPLAKYCCCLERGANWSSAKLLYFRSAESAGSSAQIEQFKLNFGTFFEVHILKYPFSLCATFSSHLFLEGCFTVISHLSWNQFSFPVWLFETFLFCLSFYQKSPICHQSHWRLLSPVLTCPLMANKCNNTFFPKPHQTFYGQMFEMNLMRMPVTSWWHISVRIWNLFPKTALYFIQ